MRTTSQLHARNPSDLHAMITAKSGLLQAVGSQQSPAGHRVREVPQIALKHSRACIMN